MHRYLMGDYIPRVTVVCDFLSMPSSQLIDGQVMTLAQDIVHIAIRAYLGPLLLTWFNFNPIMGK